MISEPPVCEFAELTPFAVALAAIPLVPDTDGGPAGARKRRESAARSPALGCGDGSASTRTGCTGTFTHNTALAASRGGAGHVLQTLADPTELF